MDKYLDNSLTNPTFLFHGSPKKLEVIEIKPDAIPLT